MRVHAHILLLALALAPAAIAKDQVAPKASQKAKKSKKKTPSKYNPSSYLKEKGKRPVVAGTDQAVTAETKSVAGYDVNCSTVNGTPTPQQAATEKAADEVKAEDAPVSSTQQAFEMAKTVVKTVKDNCRTTKNDKTATGATIEPDVGVSVSDPGDLGTKESTGQRPELSGTVGVSATF